MRRSCLRVALLGAIFTLAPSAAAQTLTITPEWGHDEITLPETGRGDVALILHAKVRDTNCATDETFSIDLKLDGFEKWAGASLLPPQATFVVPQGAVVGEQNLPSKEAVLNLAWNVEDAPPGNMTQVYVVNLREEDVTKSGGPCLPDVTMEDTRSAPLLVRLEAREAPIEPVDCAMDPYQPMCAATVAEPSPPTPWVGPVGLLAVLGLGVLAWRRFGFR